MVLKVIGGGGDGGSDIEKELEDQREDLQRAENANVLAHQEFKKCEHEAKIARENKNKAEQELKDLQNEEEQLENVKNFRHKIHEEELEAVRDYVEQWLEHGEEPEQFIEEHKKRKSSNDGSSR